jgi:hypothetical protein
VTVALVQVVPPLDAASPEAQAQKVIEGDANRYSDMRQLADDDVTPPQTLHDKRSVRRLQNLRIPRCMKTTT